MIWRWFGGTYKDARDQRNFFARFCVEPDKFFRVRPEIGLPEDQEQAFQRERRWSGSYFAGTPESRVR